MVESKDDFRERLFLALQQSDDLRRADRVNRMLSVAPNIKSAGIVVGEIDTLAIKDEAYECFVNGHYIATLLLVVSFVEHTLTDSLVERGEKRPRNLEAGISKARELSLFPDDLLGVAEGLREVRNAFSHRKPAGHRHSLGTRYREQKKHPSRLLEEDARQALETMYRFFDLSVRG